jgi:hypothetical protein
MSWMLPSVMCLQGNLQVAGVYAGNDCIQLKGPEIVVELNRFLRLLTLCMLFSKKKFPVFLESAGYSEEDVLLHKPKAEVCYCSEYHLFYFRSRPPCSFAHFGFMIQSFQFDKFKTSISLSVKWITKTYVKI